jgi:uncharacterized glyoxalase superfamily protein PhnB
MNKSTHATRNTQHVTRMMRVGDNFGMVWGIVVAKYALPLADE